MRPNSLPSALPLVLVCAVSAVSAVSAGLAGCAPAPQAPGNNGEYPLPAGEGEQQPADDLSWPQRIAEGQDSVLLYPPKATAWLNDRFSGRLPAEIDRADSGKSYGWVYIEAGTKTDPSRGVATFTDVRIVSAHFPAEAAQDPTWLLFLQEQSRLEGRELAVTRINDDLAEARRAPVVVKNDAPRILFVTQPEVLVLVDGPPVIRKEDNVSRVINTRQAIYQDGSGFVSWIGDRWFRGATIEGEYQPTNDVKPEFDLSRANLVQAGKVDTGADATPKTAAGAHPLVATSPTEIIETKGAAQYSPIDNTTLDYVTNTDADVFRDRATSTFYVLVAGRWYRSTNTSGPWTYVAAKEMPPVFASIPADSPKADVRASLAGSVEAQEAEIASQIPVTAAVDRSHATLAVAFDGQPQFEPVQGADPNLQAATNSDTPVVQSGGQYYALSDGVWFIAPSPNGPWAVATSVPESVYSIPPSSPLYYTTYVRVYDVTPDYVYYGYTPGYYGAYYSDGVVVYGTGYRYRPWVGGVWYGRPVTWGYGVGFGFGVGVGFAYGGWGRPWAGPARYNGFDHGRGYGYGASAGARAPNAYAHWGAAARPSSAVSPSRAAVSGRVGASPNVGPSRTSAAPRVGNQVQSASAPRGATGSVRPQTGNVRPQATSPNGLSRPQGNVQQRVGAPQQQRPTTKMPARTTVRRRSR